MRRNLGLLVAFLTALLTAGLARADEACGLHQVASLDTTQRADGRLMVESMLDGGPVQLMLDTGSPESALFSDVVADLKLLLSPVTGTRYIKMNGQSIHNYVRAKSFTLGNWAVDSPEFLVFPRRPNQGSGIDGVLGTNLFFDYDVEIDPVTEKMKLYSRDHCPEKVVYWSKDYVEMPIELDHGHHIFVPALLNGHKLKALLDTGSTELVLSLPVAESMFGLTPDSPGVTRDDTSPPSFVSYRTQFDTLSLGGIEFHNLGVRMIPDKLAQPLDKTDFEGPRNAPERPQLATLIIGMRELRKLHLYIAYDERRLYATAADAH